jgi:hypothetical protein
LKKNKKIKKRVRAQASKRGRVGPKIFKLDKSSSIGYSGTMKDKKQKENYFINDDGLCVCVMSDMDSVYDTLAGHYKHCYGVIADDFDEDGIHKDA